MSLGAQQMSGMGRLNLVAIPRPVKINGDTASTRHHEYVSVARLGEFDPTLRYDGSGGSFGLYERITGLPWMRERIERDRTSANYQGNPLWPIQVLHQKSRLAAFFGVLGAADDRRCCIPSAQAINKRLCVLRAAGLGTTFEFAAYRDDHPISDCSYIEAFVHSRTLPCAEENSRDFLHDWSYHFVSLLLPEFLEGIRTHVEILLRLSREIRIPTKLRWGVYGHTEDELGQFKTRFIDEELPYEKAIARRLSIEIDVLTARPVQALIEVIEGRTDRAARIARHCSLFLGTPTLTSLCHLLPELRQVPGIQAASLPAQEHAHPRFTDYSQARLDALDDALGRIDALQAWSVPLETMSAVLAHLALVRMPE